MRLVVCVRFLVRQVMKKTLLATAILLAFATSASAETINNKVLTLEEGEVYTHISHGKDFITINGQGASLTLKASDDIRGDGAGIFMSASNPNDCNIYVKDLTVINEDNRAQAALSNAIYISGAHDLYVEAENVTIEAKSEDALFINSGGSATFKNVKYFKASSETDRSLRAVNGTLDIIAADTGAEVDVGLLEVGYKNNTNVATVNIVNPNGTNLIDELKIFGSATGNLSGNTTINKPVNLVGDLGVSGNLNLGKGENTIAQLTGNNASLRFGDTETKANIANVLGDLKLAASGDLNDSFGGKVADFVGSDNSLVTIANGGENVSVVMAEGMATGEVTASLNADGSVNTDSLVTKTNSVLSNTLDLASAAPLAMNRLLMNDVRKRMGDLRSAEGTHGVWARYDGGKLSGANGLENDFTTVQVGIDTVPVADAPRFGVAFAYTQSDADMKRGGAEMDAFSLAFYGTKMYDNGMFIDVIGRMATADTDVTVDGDKKGSMDNVALSLSGELGWRFDVTEKFYFEPQAELTYTYVNADKLTLSNGSAYEFDSVDSLMGRVGFAAGFKCPNNFGDVYVRASVVHEFLGDAVVRGGSALHEVDGKDTWVEYGIGANFNVNKNTYVYADIERTEGAALEEDWRANVGVRFAF